MKLWSGPVAAMLILAVPGGAGSAMSTHKPHTGVDAVWSYESTPVPGSPATVLLQVTARRPLTRLRVALDVPAGAPWLLESFPLYEGELAEGSRLEFRARVRVPDRPGTVLAARIRFETSGGSMETRAARDLIPADRHPSRIQGVAHPDGGGGVFQYRPSAAPAPRTAPGPAAQPELAFTGVFVYRDRVFDANGFLFDTAAENPVRPVRFADVQLLENDVVVATGSTDATGAYAFNRLPAPGAAYRVRVLSSTANSAGTDIRVRLSASSSAVYAVATGAIQSPVADVDLGTVVIEPLVGGEGFNILDQCVEAAGFVAFLDGAEPVFPLAVIWNATPGNFTGFTRDNLTIQLDPDEGYDDCVILHEFGHYVSWIYSKDDSPRGLHFINGVDQDVRLSWSEGFASFFQSAVRYRRGDAQPAWYVDTAGTPGQGQLQFSYECETPSFPVRGPGSEVVIQALLWEIVDGPDTPGDPTPGVDDDAMELPVGTIWSVITGPIKATADVSLEDFWDAWFAPGSDQGFAAEMRDNFNSLGAEYYADALEDDATTPVAVPLDGTAFHRTFFPVGDEDTYTLDLTAGRETTVETLNIQGYGDTRLEIRDPDGLVVAQSDNWISGDLASRSTVTAPVTGTYTVIVRRSFGDARSQYTRYGSYDFRAVDGGPGPSAFTLVPGNPVVNDPGFGVGIALTDYDQDGMPDLYVVNNSSAGPGASADKLFRNQGGLLFTDATAAAGLGNPEGGIAVAWGDYDNDGDADLFVSDHGLYRNTGFGAFTDVTNPSGVADIGREFDAAWVDIDGDGLLDLFVVAQDVAPALWHNRGDGTFENVAAAAGFDDPPNGGSAYSGVWGDYDGDRRPDLFVARRSPPYHALYRNLGSLQFAEVTAAAGVTGTDPATGGLWGDLNGDGRLDLFVASQGPNRVYLNQGGGVFLEGSADLGMNDPGPAQGATLADYDLDGDPDLYVAVTGRPNLFYRNLGGTFLRLGEAAQTGTGFGCIWVDLDNDGDPELYTSRGCGSFGCEPNALFRNLTSEGGNASWIKVALQGRTSNRDGLGARIRVHAGGRIQEHELGTGYGWAGRSRLPELFGLGGSATVDSVEVEWPSGIRDVVRSPGTWSTLVVTEGTTGEPPVSSRLLVSVPFPNPAAAGSSLRLTLPERGRVVVQVFDLQGRRVRTVLDRDLEGGTQEITWDGLDDRGVLTPSGVYFYRIEQGSERVIRRQVRIAPSLDD